MLTFITEDVVHVAKKMTFIDAEENCESLRPGYRLAEPKTLQQVESLFVNGL